MERALLTLLGLRSRSGSLALMPVVRERRRAMLQNLHYFGELMNTEKVRL